MSEHAAGKTLDLFRLIVHDIFDRDQATEACISVRTGDGGARLIAIATDCDAFGRFFRPVGRLRDVVSETCKTMAVICRDRAIIHNGPGSKKVEPSTVDQGGTIYSIGVELKSSDHDLRADLIEMFESLIPPPNLHLEVQGHHVRHRVPLRIIDLSVDDGVMGKLLISGELHNVPVQVREAQVFIGGIPVGKCDVDYQFNVTSGASLKDAARMLGEINKALLARMPSPLNGKV